MKRHTERSKWESLLLEYANDNCVKTSRCRKSFTFWTYNGGEEYDVVLNNDYKLSLR